MNIKGLDFIETSSCWPEQYDVKDLDGNQVGYVRLRHGVLYCKFPCAGGEIIYDCGFGNDYQGCFENDEQRHIHLEIIANKLKKRIGMQP